MGEFLRRNVGKARELHLLICRVLMNLATTVLEPLAALHLPNFDQLKFAPYSPTFPARLLLTPAAKYICRRLLIYSGFVQVSAIHKEIVSKIK